MASTDRFDGLEVDRQQAKFAGTVDIDPTDVERMSIDSEVMALVVCRVGGASVDENAAGDLVRTNKFKIQGFALIRDSDLQKELSEKVGLHGEEPEPTLDFYGERVESPDDPPAGVTADGEIDPAERRAAQDAILESAGEPQDEVDYGLAAERATDRVHDEPSRPTNSRAKDALAKFLDEPVGVGR